MQKILLTGMSSTGKSSVIGALAARGYNAIDLDTTEWSEWTPYVPIPGLSEANPPEREWIWRVDRVRDLLDSDDADQLFVAGCASNMSQFYARFDRVVLLSAPTNVLMHRLATRTNNSYGQRTDELQRILADIAAIEPLLRRHATHEITTAIPLDAVVAAVLQLSRRSSPARKKRA